MEEGGGRVEFEGMRGDSNHGREREKGGSRIEARLAERAQGGWSPEAARDPGVWFGLSLDFTLDSGWKWRDLRCFAKGACYYLAD